LFRALNTGDAGVFEAGEATAGMGPWITLLGGVIVICAGIGIFAGLIDPPVPVTGRRGIQPPR
jgi:hypothetical protein